MHHMGFEMSDDRALDEALARARAAGIEPELVLEHPTKRAVFIKDPDGMRIEFSVARETPFARRREGDENLVAYLG
jgi:catechol 2,3-dioxygenase-like lactoylglutathione lyase family enzyme